MQWWRVVRVVAAATICAGKRVVGSSDVSAYWVKVCSGGEW